MSNSQLGNADVLIITVTRVESLAVLKAFEQTTGNKAKTITIDGRVYRDMGEIQGSKIFMALSEMGAGGLGAAQQAVQKGIMALNPHAVIMVGIAFGVSEKDQSIGEILVSKQLMLYDLQKRGKNGKITPRGDRPHASPRLINYLQNAYLDWEGDKVDFGLILTGDKLVDNINYRNSLIKLELEAIGGEMEGAGLYASCQDAKVDWILVKAICDWADGNKHQDKKSRQELAAQNAATFVIYALQHAPLERPPGLKNKSTSPNNTEGNYIGIATESKIIESSFSAELEQLRTELGDVYAERLESIIATRGAGNIVAAWNKLIVELASLAGNQISQDIQARYYYLAARWAQEDDKPVEQYTSYYKTARRLNPKIDDRTYRAFELARKRKFDDAIAILSPLDSESVVIFSFKYLLDSGRFSEIDEFMSKLETPVTDEMLRFQALCLLAMRNADGAWQVLTPALSRNQDNILFQLTAAYIAFWQALPIELHSVGVVPPQFFISNMFSLSGDRERQMRVALSYSEQALKNINAEPRSEVKQAVNSAYLAVCVCLPDKHADAIEKAKSVLTENPIDPASILCLMRLMADYDWGHTLDALHKVSEQSDSPIWQIELYTDLLLHTSQDESAWQHLLRFENRFSANDEDRKLYWFDRSVHSLESLGRLSELAERITELDDSVEYRRVKAGYWLRSGKISDGITIAKELANNPGTRLDYINLVNIYHQERMWQELAESANLCLERLKEETPAHIAEKLAQALLALNKPKEALAVLEQYRSVFEREGLINNYYASRMTVQIALGQYLPAWEASEPLWLAKPNEWLLAQRAILQAWMGDVPRAIELLKQGFEQGFQTPQVLMQIAQYSLANDREEAFRYAQDAAELFPDDPQLLLSATMVGFESGHSDWAAMQLGALRRNFPDSGLLQEIKLPTLLEWMHEGQELSRTNWQQFLGGQIPQHLWLDSKRAWFGAEFYWRWHNNHDKPLCQHVPLHMSYGGGTIEPLLNNWQGRTLSMDYSACLIAHELKLFPFLDKAFDEIYIAPCLFAIIGNEIQQLARAQSDLIEQAEQLFKRLDSLPLKWLPEPKLETGEFSGLQYSDRVDWYLAEKHNLWIVKEHFATELFESGDIPEALKSLRTTYADVFAAMEENCELFVGENQLEKISAHGPDPLKIKQLNNCNNLLVDRHFLELLLNLDVLEASAKLFNLNCIDGLREQLLSDIESYRYRHKIKAWLESLQSELKRLQAKRKLKFLTLQRIPEESPDDWHLSLALQQLLLGVEQSEFPVWIDDRLLGSYATASASQNAPIVGVHDMLALLYSRKVISEGKFIESFRNLFRAGVGCRLPPVSYFMREIAQAKFDAKSGCLIENSILAKLRESVFLALSPTSILNKEPLRPDLLPEEAMFRFQLHRLADAAMVEIWTSDNFDRSQRSAMADWLYYQFLPQRGRPVSFGEKFSIEPIHQLAMEHSFRMSLPWTFLNQPHAISEYFQWLFTYIESVWQNQPTLREAALLRFTELIINQLKFCLQNEDRTLAINVFTIPLRHFPNDIFAQLLTHPSLEPHLKNYFSMGEYIESLDLFIPEYEWKELVEASINLGVGKPLLKTVKGRNITLDFKPKNGVGDMLIVSGQAANGHPSQLHILIPFDRLEHSISDRRIEWLDEVSLAGLITDDDSTSYRSILASADFNEAAEALRNCCDRSGDFFFAFAQYALKISKFSKHHWNKILPANTEILISASPHEMSAKWLFADISNPVKTKKRLASVAALPFGEPFDLATFVEQALSAGWISTEKMTELLDDLAASSLNPAVLQNLLTVYLRLPDKVSKQKQIETLIQTLLTLEGNSETDEAFERYIELLHLIWNYFQLTAEFKKCTFERRVTWAYIYADRMLGSMLQQKGSDSDYWVIASKNIKEAVAALQAQQDPFVSVEDNEADVILPSAASWWRTIIGGTLGILRRDVDYLNNVQQTVIEILQPLLNACNTYDHSKLRSSEFLEPTDFTNNHRNSAISSQGWICAEQLRTKLSGEQYLPQNQRIYSWMDAAIDNGDFNFIAGCFSLLARYPDSVAPELVEPLTNVIENLIEENSFDQTNQKLFLAQAELLGRLNSEQALNLRGRLIDKTIDALHNDPALWLFITNLLLKLYSFDGPVQRIDKFIVAINRIAAVLPINTKEFSELCAFIRRIEAYMPAENWPTLWKVLELDG
jgi:nucleoside phosphorylase